MKPMGWSPNPAAVDQFVATLRRPVFRVGAVSARDTGAGRVVLLHRATETAFGRFPVRQQTIGDCVSQAWALAVDVLAAVEIVIGGEAETVGAVTATEPIYALSRVEVGGGRLDGDGAVGAWAARAVQEFGTLRREKFGAFDLRKYSGRRAREWGKPGRGLPDRLEPVAREHRVRSVSLVTSYEEARDAIANGYPVPVCSRQGFRERRDGDGFARPRGTWAHAMLFCGVDDDFRRPGLLCVNSWGRSWISGPIRHGQPDGSFWVDAEVADKMLRREPDSFSVSGFEGYPVQSLPDFLGVWS